jgi:hypothetical protein
MDNTGHLINGEINTDVISLQAVYNPPLARQSSK